jgi:hypothetical protein
VVQVHFELRRGAFLDDGVGRNALLFRAFEDVLQAIDVFVEVVDQVHLGRHRALAGDWRAWRLRTTVHVVLVDQVELQLERGADGQAQVVELAHDLAQHFSRVGEERFTFELVHGHQQLRGRALLPGFDAEGAGNGETDPVGVADVQSQTGAFHRGAVDIQGKQRRRQVDAFFVHLMKTGAFDALAAHHTVHIRNQKVDVQNLRIFLKECVCFVELNGTQRDRHDAPISC